VAQVSAEDTLRVLLVAESEALRDQIGAILTQFAGEHRVYWVAQPEVAPRRAEELLPHLVLVDDHLGNTTAPSVVRAVVAALPTAATVVLVDETAISVAREAVLSGARGFVVKPLAAEDFWATIYQVLTQQQEATAATPAAQDQGGKVIAFVGSKGGTGRTLSAVNTAISLHRQQKRSVVIVDADYAAPAVDVMLNLEGDKDISLLLARLSRLDAELIDGVLAHHSSGIRVLLAPPPGQGMPAITMQHLEQVVGYLRQMFDWVIVDLGAANGEADYAFLDFADQVVVVTLPEMVCLRNTRLMLDQFQLRGYQQEQAWLLLNRATMNGGIRKRDIEERLHVRIKHTVPEDQPLVSYSVNRGVPLVMSNPRSAVARALVEFAALFGKPAGKAVKAKESSGVFGKFFRHTSSAPA
jgi:pilus assembly protein CpaE